MTIVLNLLAWALISIGCALCCGEFFEEDAVTRKLGPPKGR